ncbi:hypothetical protein ACJIZ3_002366 [Penstemon smallii]|uniref:NUC153 domain-containing protein n=1 Tax=Penstemon smallii TaxID=265156 RepID=A0ABD3U914_9LAMI
MGSDEKKNKKPRNKKKNSGGGRNGGGAPGNDESKMITDERFASAQSDPRFMEAPKRRSKVEIDSRFQRIFTDRSFASSKAPIDKRGKPNIENNKKATSSLSHYYRLQQKEEDKDVDDEGDSDDESESDKLNTILEEEDEEEEGGMQSSDESSSTSTTDSDDESVDEEEDTFMQQEENVPEIDKETRRLAVVNLDWSHVRAVDLYVLLSSFLPKGGQIMSVAVYPTDFGLQRMEEEAVHGPVGLFDDEKEHGDEDDDDEIDNKKLRAYEQSRLRYYYAVVECDSSATADYLYETCDGVEFERSANKLDLRFIPDSMDFKHKPRDVATEAPAEYEGLDFQTQALQHSNIHLMWDEDEPMRTKTLKSLLKSEQPGESELNEILATDESETDEDDNADGTMDRSMKKRKRKDMYLSLIQSGDGSDESGEEDNDQDMEVTFNSGLEEISKRILEKKDNKSETVWEANLRKRKEKKKAMKNRSKYSSEDDNSDDPDRELGEQPDDFFEEEISDNKVRTREAEASTAELELLLADDTGADNNNIKGFNLKPKKSKGKKGKEIPDEGKIPTIDYDDPRFSSLFANPLFALDPTDPQFKRSAAYARQIAQEKKGDDEHVRQMDSSVAPEMKGSEAAVNPDELVQRKEKHELSALVRSIKMKSKQVNLSSQVKVHQKHQHLRPKAKIHK